jgi:uncharacterized protein
MKVNSKIILFVLLTISLTLGVHFFGSMIPDGVQSLLFMWTPGLSAILVSLIYKRPFKEFGWRFNWSWMGLGWVIPIVYASLAYVFIWALGLGGVPNPTFLERAQLTTGFESESSLAIILVAFFYITLVNLLPSMVLSLGEELGWRGFLVPELAKENSFRKTALFSGAIWAVWHLPGILSGSYGASTTPLWFRLVCFLIMVLAGAVILAWIRLESGSIWAVAIFHATHNGVIQAFYERLTVFNDATPYFAGEFGLAIPIFSVVFSIWILSQKRKESIEPILIVD